jgi:integrase
MSVRKRTWTTSRGEAKEAWIVDYSDQAGTRRLKTFERKKDADAYAQQVGVDIRAGVHSSTKTAVAEAGRKWVEDATHRLEAATVESYAQHLADHIIPYLGKLRLSQLSVPAVRTFMDRLRADGRSPAMVKRVVGDLGSILADAQGRGLVAQNVVRSLSRRRERQAERRNKRKLKVGVDIPSLPRSKRL